MENNIFSSTRCVNYLNKYIIENRRQLLVNLAMIFGLLIVMAVFISYVNRFINPMEYEFTDIPVDPMWRKELTTFTAILMVWAAFFGSKFFSVLSAKSNRASVLTNPASNLEKFTVYFMIYVVGFYIAFVAASFLADFIRVCVSRMYMSEGVVIATIPVKYVLTMGYSVNLEALPAGLDPSYMSMVETKSLIGPMMTIGSLLVIESVFALGSILWAKSPMIKTIGVVALLVFLYNILLIWGFKVLLPGASVPRYDFDWSAETTATVGYVITAIICIFNYWIAYARFKESEIVERW